MKLKPVRLWMMVSVVVCLLVVQGRALASSAWLNFGLLEVTSVPTAKIIEQSLKINPTSQRAAFHHGRELFLKGMHATSEGYLIEASARSYNPDALASLYLGLVQQALGREKAALDTWRKVPTISYYHLHQGNVSLVADDTQSANQFFSLSTQIASGHADHFCDSILGSANALLAEDAEQAALDKLESATVICPLNIEIIDAIVRIYFYRTDLTKAAEWELIAADILNDHRKHLYRGRAMLWQEQYPEAVESLNIYVSKVPTSDHAYGLLCESYRKDGKLGEAIDACQERIEVATTKQASMYANLGDVWLAVGGMYQARIAYESALEVDPDYQRAKDSLSELSP